MKFELPSPVLLSALQKCATVISGKSTLPILSCVSIRSGTESLTITATSLDSWVSCTVPSTIIEQGDISISHKTLIRISGGSQLFHFAADKKRKCTVTLGTSRFTLHGLDAEELPAPPDIDATPVKITASAFRTAHRRTGHSVSTDPGRAMLHGQLFTARDSILHLVATNGHTLALHPTGIKWDAPDAIVPPEAMAAISAIAPEDDVGEITLQITASHIAAFNGEDTITAKLIEANFPNYMQVIPDYTGQATTLITADPADLIQALRTIAPAMDGETTTVVQFTATADSLLCDFTGKEKTGSATVDITARLGEDPSFALNSQILLYVLKPLAGGENITIEMLDGMSPVILTAGDTRQIIMPMRIVQ